MYKRPIILICCLLMQGCIIAPSRLADEVPFSDALESSITPGETSREEVRELFGYPRHTHGDDLWWLYRDSRKLTEWMLLIVTQGGMEFAEFGGAVEDYWLAVEFQDQNTVATATVMRVDHDCLSSDPLCIGDSSISVRGPLRFDPTTRSQSCLVFVFWDSVNELEQLGSLQVDDKPFSNYRFSRENFVLLQLSASPHEVLIGLRYLSELVYESISLDCESGSEIHLAVREGDGRPRVTVQESVPGSWESALSDRRQTVLRDHRSPAVEETPAAAVDDTLRFDEELTTCEHEEANYTVAVSTIPETPRLLDVVTLVLRAQPADQSLSYRSVFVTVPENSSSTLRFPRSRMPDFDADQPGEYIIQTRARQPTADASCQVEIESVIVIGPVSQF